MSRWAARLAFGLIMSCGAAMAQEQPAAPAANDAIEAKIAELRSALAADTSARQADIAKIQASIAALAAELKTAVVGNDAGLKAAESQAANAADALSQEVDHNAALDELRLKALEAKVKDLGAQPPWWASTVLGAVLGAATGFASSFFFARAASEEALRVRLRDAANEMCEQWRAMEDTIANARYLVGQPPRLVDPVNRNIVVGYGNWLDRLGVRWRLGDLDVPYVRAQGLDGIVRGFWTDLDQAVIALTGSGEPQQEAAGQSLRKKQAGWSGFEWLANQPPQGAPT